ncbi:MAG: hypothetical protein A3F13_09710 [Gammaproteobacteria bacterium RIFCSPHIGHO2_12_FULL_40_19]|nr:MAG: hypothetical protein A3F13_09710 [Gammaproteobacteria bacterium RIFCSPHIGHO2_12_FULL_40_19]
MIFKQLLLSGNYATNRLEAFSDGVFAIIITLLILDIHTPEIHAVNNEKLFLGLIALTPKILIYIISFLNIAVYWINHHQLFSVLKRTDRGFLWLNCLLLLVLVFVPFPTSVVGEYPDQIIAITFFGLVMMVAAIIFGTMRLYSAYYGCLVNCDLIDDGLIKREMFKSYSGALFYAVAILAGFISTKLSIAFYFVIPLLYALPGKLDTL